MRKPLVFALALVVMWYGFAVSAHAFEHPFHKHVVSCDVLVAAEKNGACPPSTFKVDAPVVLPCPAVCSEYQTVLSSLPYTLYLSRAPPVVNLGF